MNHSYHNCIILLTNNKTDEGRKPGRESDEEIIVFDSTGTALQDVASAALVYERAMESGVGVSVNFAD